MLEHGDAHAAFNGLIAVHHQEPIDHRFRVETYNLVAGERHFAPIAGCRWPERKLANNN